MASLSDKLQSLGVKIGAQDLPRPGETVHPQEPLFSVERVLPGRVLENSGGQSYLVEREYPCGYAHGESRLQISASLEAVASWADEPLVASATAAQIGFLDIETTGLSGGTGTYAFLVGAARFTGDHFHLAQFFMRDPSEEPAHLLALEAFLAPCDALVTFNGKSFDVPLLATRYLAQGWQPPLAGLAHVDLLHLARRLWRDRLPNRTLGNLEVQILGVQRAEEDIPGWLVPQMYFDYLRSGDARPLTGVFYHNAMDVVTLAALLNHVAGLLADPLHASLADDLDWPALGRLFDDLGRHDVALQLYQRALSGNLPLEHRQDTRRRYSMLHKRLGHLAEAVSLWEQSAGDGEIYACIELAKICEHDRRDPSAALRWTQAAQALADGLPRLERDGVQADLAHRRQRLELKIARNG